MSVVDSQARRVSVTGILLVIHLLHHTHASAPSFPIELSANVSMNTLEPGMPHYTGSYQVWQSLSQGLATHLGDDGAGGTSLSVMMPSPFEAFEGHEVSATISFNWRLPPP